MKINTTRQMWMIVLGWIIFPGLCLLIGFFLGRLLATYPPTQNVDFPTMFPVESALSEKLFYGGLLGMLIGFAIGLFGACILPAQIINPLISLSDKQIGIVTAGWLLAYIIGIVVTIFLTLLVAFPVFLLINFAGQYLNLFHIMGGMEIVVNLAINLPIGMIGGGFSMGYVGSFITNAVLIKLQLGLEKETHKAINLRWGAGFTVGGLLGGIFIGYGIGYFLATPFVSFTPIGAIALAIGFAIMGLCSSLIGGRFMLKRLGEPASARASVRGV